jgi:hypothetical protein
MRYDPVMQSALKDPQGWTLLALALGSLLLMSLPIVCGMLLSPPYVNRPWTAENGPSD